MKTNRLLSSDPGMLPPQAPEIEEAVMGALLLETTAFERIEDKLEPDDFYRPAHQQIFRAMLRLRSRHHPIDMLTVTEELSRMKVLDQIGGPYYISQLTSRLAGTNHLEHHAAIVRERAEARELIRITSGIASSAYDPAANPAELIERLEKQLTALTTRSGTHASLTMAESLRLTIKHVEALQTRHENGQAVVIPTGLTQLDKALYGGWHPGDLIVLGGRPSMGKTQMALSFAKAAALHDNHVLFVSTETPPIPLTNRYILEEETIDPAHLRTGQMTPAEWDALDRQVGKLWDLNLHIAAQPDNCYLHTIRSEARRLKRLGQLDMVLVDYLTMLKTRQKFERRDLEVGYITKELKRLARELDVPVVVTAQIKRPAPGMKVEEPTLNLLRESGEIEQHADIVIFIHKPAYYVPTAVDGHNVPWTHRGKLLIDKQREGSR